MMNNHSIPLHPKTQSRGINPQTPTVLVQGDQSPKTLQKRLRYDEKKSFNPPAPKDLVQGDQSPNTQSPSPGGSIPQYPDILSKGTRKVKCSIPHLLGCQSRGINPPPTRSLVQGDQSPTYQVASPGGSIPHLLWAQSSGINPPPKSALIHWDQSPVVQRESTSKPPFHEFHQSSASFC